MTFSKLLKNWKLLLAALAVAMFTACAGSSGGSGASEGGQAAGPAEEQKEVIDEGKLKAAEQEAMSLTEENHKLRREIFEAKNKLGMPTDSPAATDAPAEEPSASKPAAENAQ